MGAMKGIFGRIANSKVQERHPRLEAGEYPSLTLLKLFMFQGGAKRDKDVAIAEILVNESKATPENDKPAPAGSKRAIAFTFDDDYGYGEGRLKAFILNLFGATEENTPAEEVEGTIFDLLANDDQWKAEKREGASPKTSQPMRGKTFAGTGMLARKKGELVKGKDGGPVVNYTWRPLEQSDEQIVAERARVDKLGL